MRVNKDRKPSNARESLLSLKRNECRKLIGRKTSKDCVDVSSNLQPIECIFCEKPISPNHLFTHLESHSRTKGFHNEVLNLPEEPDQYEPLRSQSVSRERSQYTCEHCNMIFPLRQDLVVHKRTHTNDKPHKCTYCEQSFISQDLLRRHQVGHRIEMPYKCHYCRMLFPYKGRLNKHEKIHIKRPFQGEYPSTRKPPDLKSKAVTLKSRSVARKTNEKPHKCAYCDQSFISRDLLRRHQVCHRFEVPYKCKYCLQPFVDSWRLKRHEKTHVKKRFGGKYSAQRKGLVMHKRRHNSKKPCKCSYCDQSFTSRLLLMRHQVCHGVDVGYKCKSCLMSFLDTWHLKRHEKVHERSFQGKRS